MIRDASTKDLPALRELFARANDEPYDLGAVAGEKCFGEGIAGTPKVRVHGGMEGAVVTCGRYVRILIVDRDARRRGVGTALLADAEARGTTVIAAEPGNYFTPGVSAEATEAFFRACGYAEKAATWNLDSPLEEGERPARRAGETPALHRPTHAEADRVLAFIEREFGRIWRFEAAKAFAMDVPQIFVTEDESGVTGFAAHDVNNRGLGFFGPTGVAKSMRGRGLGCRLLTASLEDLRRLGYGRAVIPWTDALDFYRKCSGAKPAHRFIAFEKTQP